MYCITEQLKDAATEASTKTLHMQTLKVHQRGFKGLNTLDCLIDRRGTETPQPRAPSAKDGDK